MAAVFRTLTKRGFDLRFTFHAEAILLNDFPEAAEESERIVGAVEIPIEELIRGGGGEAAVTQRLRRDLSTIGWRRQVFHVEKKINDKVTRAESHEIDHVEAFENGAIALEIEWNNKDPFFDRDLENFNRLHDDGAISVGIIVTRGKSFQGGILNAVRAFADSAGLRSATDLNRFRLTPTPRQVGQIETAMMRHGMPFAESWARFFVSDKFGSATTHWAKLVARLERGVGSPCPMVGIGIPIACVFGWR
jgi:hypothetical protein